MTPVRLCPHGARPDRCPDCARIPRGNPGTSGQQGRIRRSQAEWKRRREVVEAHRQKYGDWCPGVEDLTEPHEASDLTAHHVEAQSAGGVAGALQVLCRSCNARAGRLGLRANVVDVYEGKPFLA